MRVFTIVIQEKQGDVTIRRGDGAQIVNVTGRDRGEVWARLRERIDAEMGVSESGSSNVMSATQGDKEWTEYRRALDWTCPQCGATSGNQCVSMAHGYVHEARKERGGRVGLKSTLCMKQVDGGFCHLLSGHKIECESVETRQKRHREYSLRYRCPTCNAEEGRPCVFVVGRGFAPMQPHEERVKLVPGFRDPLP